jgi:transposase-like protein
VSEHWFDAYRLSARARNVLLHSGVTSPAEAKNRGRIWWMTFPNCGQATVNELEDVFGSPEPPLEPRLAQFSTRELVAELERRNYQPPRPRVQTWEMPHAAELEEMRQMRGRRRRTDAEQAVLVDLWCNHGITQAAIANRLGIAGSTVTTEIRAFIEAILGQDIGHSEERRAVGRAALKIWREQQQSAAA